MSLWYGSDEVREFHPIVEKCINNALKKLNLEDEYQVKHHYGDFTEGIPDFLIVDSITDDVISVVEVKKTPTDVLGRSAGNQAKRYAEDLRLKWKLHFHPHFCVTNIELTQCYVLRENSSLIGCLLENSPSFAGKLEDDETYIHFENFFINYLSEIISKKEPQFSKHVEAISESFNESLYRLNEILKINLDRIYRKIGIDEDKLREAVLFELLRFTFYFYIKEYLDSRNQFVLPEFNFKNSTSTYVVSLIESNFTKAASIGFKDLFEYQDSSFHIFPEIILENEEICEIFVNYITTLSDNIGGTIKKDDNIFHFISLLTEEFYDKDVMHNEGKIMSDVILSELLAYLTIYSSEDIVIDPCCGDGNLLVSSYNRLNELYEFKSCKPDHNKLLNQIYGMDIDSNLVQLSTFKLIGNNLLNCNESTFTNLENKDMFEWKSENKYDALVMNPPFLRNQKLPAELKRYYLNSIESTSGVESFIWKASQPDKYYFFIEKSLSMLKENGKASIIAKTKFLNNKDGVFLKEYLLDYLEGIIAYPDDFFGEFKITTCILVLSKDSKKNSISFINIKNTNLLSDFTNIKNLLNSEKNFISDDVSLNVVPKNELNPKDNWLVYLLDPTGKFEYFNQISLLKNLTDNFGILERGKAGNSGGSSIIFPFSNNNPLKDFVPNIDNKCLCNGIRVNKLQKGRRMFILTNNCISETKGLILPEYNEEFSNGIPNNPIFDNINNYCSDENIFDTCGLNNTKWKKIVTEAHNSRVVPDILIPRGDRKKHSVYYYPFDEKILISTNFFYLSNFNGNNSIDKEKQILFIVAFLLSSFGQLQFEIISNNHEGNRKLEKFMIKKFKVLDVNELDEYEIDNVINEFKTLNSLNKDINFEENMDIRDDLDLAIGEIIFKRDTLGFSNVTELVSFFKEFNKDLIKMRLKQ